MSALPAANPVVDPGGDIGTLSELEQLQYAKDVVRREGEHVMRLAERVDGRMVEAASLLVACTGSAVVTGIGKAGIIGQKLSATLSSTGTRSHFLHSAEAVHGDLGRLHPGDVVIVLSHSGKTEEVVRLLPALAEQAAATIAITATQDSPLGRAADIVLEIGVTKEVCSLGLAPSTSTAAMLAFGDALALLTSRQKSFSADDFARFHPGGSLGTQLASVEDVMRPLQRCRIASDQESVREILVGQSQSGRRTGAVMLTGTDGRITGIFTDSDLARLLERRRESSLDEPVAAVMSREITTIQANARLTAAIDLLAKRRISELPVVDENRRPIGLIDITDVVGLVPAEDQPAPPEPEIFPFRSANETD